MFVIVQSQVNLESNDPTWKSRPVHELVGETLKHAGVAITITSVTDLLVFLIGATTVSLLKASKSVDSTLCLFFC